MSLLYTQSNSTNPKNLSYPRFFSLLLGDDLFGASTKGNPFPKEGKPAKINTMKSHGPTYHKDGYTDIRPLSKVMLEYMIEEDRVEYSRAHDSRTGACNPASHRFPGRRDCSIYKRG